ncbi:MAG: hypothetical protein HC890_04630 [Chloroflexaceae bacterium]|nr:hypothetical protein [Chloroflexaceae bacterium]
MAILTLASLLGCVTAPVAKAEDAYGLTAQNLVTLAREGHFREQGIPRGRDAFGLAVRTGRVRAIDVVESAIAEAKLPAAARDDAAYLAEVAGHLTRGGCGL